MGGKLMLNTVQGEPLTFARSGKSHLTVTDAKGDVAWITIPDVLQSNGVIHVINKVMIRFALFAAASLVLLVMTLRAAWIMALA